jgi:hypothetical protein
MLFATLDSTQFLYLINPIGTSAALIAVASAGVLSAAFSFWRSLKKRSQQSALVSTANSRMPDDQLEPVKERLEEARERLSHQMSARRVNGWIAGLLAFGQFVIGGLLASSFIQQTLSRDWIGGLGVLVLISSLIFHQIRPDVKRRSAHARQLQLQSLVWQTEDTMLAIMDNEAGAPSVLELRRRVSAELEKIEKAEFSEEPEGPQAELRLKEGSKRAAIKK